MISQVRKRLRLLPKSLKLSLAVIETGIASGFIGIFCHYLLEFIQAIVFGKDTVSISECFSKTLSLTCCWDFI